VQNYSERRKFIRMEAPVGLRVITPDNKIFNPTVKNFSTLGIRFETDESLSENQQLDITLLLPNVRNPVHISGRVVWQKQSEARAGYDVGCEFTRIEEDNKNSFLKFFCDLIYDGAVTVKKEGA